MTAPTLQITGREPVFDDRAWRWAYRDSGILAVTKPAEDKLLWLIYCHADRSGRADVSVKWAAKAIGLTPRAVREARNRLVDRGVIADDGPSEKHSSVRAYRLIMTPGNGMLGKRPGEAVFRQREKLCSGGGSCVPPEGEATFPQRGITKEKDIGGGSSAPLYERPAYDHAAAAALVESCQLSKRVAHGLISQYRPTFDQVAAIISNIEARDAEADRDPRVRRVSSRAAFTTAAIKRCDYTLDDRVIEARRSATRQAQTQADQEDHQAQAAQERAQTEQRRQADVEIWEALTAEKRTALRSRAEAKIPAWQRLAHAGQPDDSPLIRALILRESTLQTGIKP